MFRVKCCFWWGGTSQCEDHNTLAELTKYAAAAKTQFKMLVLLALHNIQVMLV